MKELKKLLYSMSDDAIEITKTTLELFPDTTLSECFPFHVRDTVMIDGFEYEVQCEIKLRPVE